jgi:hypothetical protein
MVDVPPGMNYGSLTRVVRRRYSAASARASSECRSSPVRCDDPGGDGAVLGQVGIDEREERLGLRGLDPGKHADELVPAPADDEVVRPEPFPQCCRDADQELVAGGVAFEVVDRLEVIDVDEPDGQRLQGPVRPDQFAFEVQQSRAAYVRAGEGVQ